MEASGDDVVRYQEPADASPFSNQPVAGAASEYTAAAHCDAEPEGGTNRAPCLGCTWIAFILTVAGISAHRHLLPKRVCLQLVVLLLVLLVLLVLMLLACRIPAGAHAHHAAGVTTTVINVIGSHCNLAGGTQQCTPYVAADCLLCTPPTCGQVTMASKYVPNAVAFAKGKGWVGSAGTCASKGYTTKSGTKSLPPSAMGYTGHPLTAMLYTKPPPSSCTSGFACFKSGAAFAKALNAPAKAGDRLALICPAAAPCTINSTQLGVFERVIMENVLVENSNLDPDGGGGGTLLLIGSGSDTGTKLTCRNGQAPG